MYVPTIYVNMLLVVNMRVSRSSYVAFHVDINRYNRDGGAVGLSAAPQADGLVLESQQ